MLYLILALIRISLLSKNALQSFRFNTLKVQALIKLDWISLWKYYKHPSHLFQKCFNLNAPSRPWIYWRYIVHTAYSMWMVWGLRLRWRNFNFPSNCKFWSCKTSNKDPLPHHSVTIHTLGGWVHAPIYKTILGCKPSEKWV